MSELSAIKKRKAVVVVLGDLGRSPRMQYHALSLAGNGFNVTIVAYLETIPVAALLDNDNINIVSLSPLNVKSGPKLIQYVLKAIWQTFSLLLTLFLIGNSDILLCQNPPAIPTLPVCWLFCIVTRTKFIIDWHNYAYSIMALTLSNSNLLLKLALWIEGYFGSMANKHLCVSNALKEDLEDRWGIRATVLYDRPPDRFKTISTLEKHHLFIKLEQFSDFFVKDKGDVDSSMETRFTKIINGIPELKQDRPAILFSSTSWTPDEDFNILLDALQAYETSFSISSDLPKLLCIITGKGPLKQHYSEEIALKKWKHINVIMPWLEAEDYPRMVASADLGVCLHTSSSGLDLPMKVVDMFGSGLPVCAYFYPCIEELVKNGVNGYTFTSSRELSKQIITWFRGFPNNEKQNDIVNEMKEELKKNQSSNWESNWNKRVKKIIDL